MPDTSPDLYDGKLNKINGISAHKTHQTEIYFIATSDIPITMNLIAYTYKLASSQRGASVSRHRMSTEDEKLMKGKKSDIKLNTARKTRKYVLYLL